MKIQQKILNFFKSKKRIEDEWTDQVARDVINMIIESQLLEDHNKKEFIRRLDEAAVRREEIEVAEMGTKDQRENKKNRVSDGKTSLEYISY